MKNRIHDLRIMKPTCGTYALPIALFPPCYHFQIFGIEMTVAVARCHHGCTLSGLSYSFAECDQRSSAEPHTMQNALDEQSIMNCTLVQFIRHIQVFA